MTDESKKMVDTSEHMKKSVDGASELRPQKTPSQPPKSEDNQSNNSNSNKE